jgi:hypothetical protein
MNRWGDLAVEAHGPKCRSCFVLTNCGSGLAPMGRSRLAYRSCAMLAGLFPDLAHYKR